MRKGTTPKLTFSLPFDTSGVSCVRVVFALNNTPVLVKEGEECSLIENHVVLAFTQAETFLFECDTIYQVQMRVKLIDGSVVASDIMHLPVERCLDEEVL